MEYIRKAIERARDQHPSGHFEPRQAQPRFDPGFGGTAPPPAPAPAVNREIALNNDHLESNRIIAHDIRDLRSRSFDMLRTQILQSMDMRSWQFLGITSATAACGKSVVATNLALSIARQPERSVLLIDMDLQKPQVANYLGLNADRGIVSVLAGKTTLQEALVSARIRNGELLVLPCEMPVANSSAWIASRAMDALLQEIKRSFPNWTVVIDLPPILASDDVISILPRLDCVAFVVGAGTTTAEEIKECNRHLESAEVVRVILNKSEDAGASYYYSYSAPPAPGGRSPEAAGAPRKQRNGPAAASRKPRFRRIARLFRRLGEP
jgi:capsular exopolysaccharide synthesis family protein